MDETASKIKYIDLDEALLRVRGNKKLYLRLLSMYLSNESFAEFSQSIQEGNLEKAYSSIHGIKGITSNLSLSHLYNASVVLNDQLKLGAPKESDLAHYFDAEAKTREAVIEYLSINNATT